MRFLTSFLFGPKREPPLVPIASVRVPNQHEHFLHCLARAPDLRPREASLWAFVTWMQELGEDGGREQAVLYEDYRVMCRKTGVERMPWKWFGKAMEARGCRRWKADLNRDGDRARPWWLWIPPAMAGVGTCDSEPESVVRLHRQSSRGFKPRRPVVSHETIYNPNEDAHARRIG